MDNTYAEDKLAEVSPILVRQDCPKNGRPKNKKVQEELPCFVSG
jgi:hypothetical protein